MKRSLLAVLTDLHLPDNSGTVKEEVLDWALAELKKRDIAEVLSPGDMTATGTCAAARRLKKKLSHAAKGGFFCTLGNAELRSGEDWKKVEKILAAPAVSRYAFLLDSSPGALTPKSRAELAGYLMAEENSRCLILTHFPPAELPEEDRMLLALGGKLGKISAIIHGHRHRDRRYLWKGIPSFEVRGMDPDKSIGGPPCIALFSRDEKGKWHRKDLVYKKADPRTWQKEEKEELLANLGLSGMAIPFETLAFATEKKVPVFEWRYTPLAETEKNRMLSALALWRKEGGGRCFSIHLPDCTWKEGKLSGLEALEDAVSLALLFSAQRVTVHVPRTTLAEFSNEETAGFITDRIAPVLKVLPENGIVIGIENLHMRHGEKATPARGYGYTPQEVLRYVEMLRKRGVDCGVHLDWGHVKNNAPYASFHTVSDYLALCGPLINGCHIHQVVREKDGLLHNHKALTELYGKFISLGSLFLAWKNYQIPHPPLILEIRHEMGPYSLEKLREEIEKRKY